jgi:Fe-S-cluster containining protein
MSKKREPGEEAQAALVRVQAGGFSAWLDATEDALRSGDGGADVPCGTCRGCCRGSMFIHIKPEETGTLKRIPRGLKFPAPGLPKGHVLLGYNERGECPMLVGNECSIYADRPQTCRDYDCRIFAATGIAVDAESQAEIARRVREWMFTYEDEESRERHALVKAAAAFLQGNRDLFPQGSLPSYPVQLAALAVRVYGILAERRGAAGAGRGGGTAAEIARAILEALKRDRSPLPK